MATKQETLEKAIDRAIASGWDTPLTKAEWNSDALVYRHDFAKALWGDSEVEAFEGEYGPAWQYHLQQMVISEDPIKYLEENI